MDKFYEQIKKITEQNQEKNIEPHDIIQLDEKTVIQNHIEEVLELLTSNYQDNITLAAEMGSHCAFLCIYKIGSKYRNIIDIHQLFYPPIYLENKMNEYNITKLIDRLTDMFDPFNIIVGPLHDIVNCHFSNYLKIKLSDNQLFAIAIEWN